MELCDLIAQHTTQYRGKIAWLCSRCLPAETLLSGSARVSRPQLHATLGIARIVSKWPNCDDDTAKALVLAFYRSIPASFNPNFWPQAFPLEGISSFYNDFLSYISIAAENSPDFGTDVAGFTGDIVTQTINNANSSVSRLFLNALCSNFPPMVSADVNELLTVLFDWFGIVVPRSQGETVVRTADSSSSQSLGNGSGSIEWKSNGDSDGSVSLNDVVGGAGDKKSVRSFEEESSESLEKQEIVFRLVGHIFNKVSIDSWAMEQVRMIAKDQLHSMLTFLKVCDIE